MASDYIFIRKSRNIVSNILHVALNLLLGVGSIFFTVVSGSWIIGFILVLVSKWRMFAVRAHYLFLNLKSNLVDLIVGFSFVLLAYFSGAELATVHYILAALYSLWLIIIKPKTSESWNLVQALTAVFLGTSAAAILSASVNSALFIVLEWIIGYAAAHHVLAQNNFSMHDGYPALIFGLLFAEIALLTHSWLIVYTFTKYNIMIPQVAIILSVFAFLVEQLYSAVEARDGTFKFRDVVLPFVFSVGIIAIIVIGFSSPIFNV
ncbi:hypothetical protein IJI17_02980 [Candidatus Saccharibacteria bacterium]|nr:hypothetical protein [Candidatus Saccharibacteria bacterium]